MLLVTCCHIRAVRLEWLSSLSFDALMLALTRLTARGVDPSCVLTDNGGNFDAAATYLRQILASVTPEQLQAAKPKIVWRFNPPYASHYGGVFERMIGAAKQALYHAIPSHQSMTLEQLVTAFAVVESVLNSRPLTYVSTDPQDLVPLTPNDFLYGSSTSGLLPLLLTGDGTNKTQKWRLILQVHKMFEDRFAKEVLPAYHLTRKAGHAGREIMKGDVVTFFCPSSPARWPLAKVDEVFPGRDGQVRTVRLWCPKSATRPERYFTRDVGSIALLLPEEDGGGSGKKSDI